MREQVTRLLRRIVSWLRDDMGYVSESVRVRLWPIPDDPERVYPRITRGRSAHGAYWRRWWE